GEGAHVGPFGVVIGLRWLHCRRSTSPPVAGSRWNHFQAILEAMETLANLESFVRSAEALSFSAAARRLALTPAAVSRNVARLEANLGARLFQRTTRKLTLTEDGERFLQAVSGGLESIQAAIAAM